MTSNGETERRGRDENDAERNQSSRWQTLGVLLALVLAGWSVVDPGQAIGEAAPLLATTAEASSEACAVGGVELAFGRDVNLNGQLESGEVEATTVVCDGVQGPSGAAGQQGEAANGFLLETESLPSGGACPAGGWLLAWGEDEDGSGALDPNETEGGQALCHGTLGPSGPAGADGINGIDGADGEGGTNGVDGTTSLILPRPVPTEVCSNGFVLVMGLDNGEGAGTATDGLLHDDEVDHALRLCKGALVAGPLADLNPGGGNSFTTGCEAMALGPDGREVWAAMTDGSTGCELYRIPDGTSTPVRIADVNPAGDAEPGRYLGLVWDEGLNRLLFDALDENGDRDLWAYSPTDGQVHRLTSAPGTGTVTSSSKLTPWLGGQVLAQPGGAGVPWWADGSPNGTVLLDQHPSLSNATALGTWASGQVRMGLEVLATTDDGLWMDVEGQGGDVELVLIDETGQATVHEIHPSASSSPSGGVAIGGGLAVVATTLEGRQLVHVMPEAGPRTVTSLVRSNGQQPAVMGEAFGLVAMDGMVLFDAVLDGADASLWRWDSATDDVVRLSTDILAPGVEALPTVHAGRVWFSCVTMATGSELCSSAGSPSETQVHDLRSGWQGSLPRQISPLEDGVLVLADNGSGFALHHFANDLWTPLHDPWPAANAEAGRYGGLLVGMDRVVFVAHDGATGHELHGWCHGAFTGAWTIWP